MFIGDQDRAACSARGARGTRGTRGARGARGARGPGGTGGTRVTVTPAAEEATAIEIKARLSI